MNFFNKISVNNTHYQKTINKIINFSGIGIHTGIATKLKLIPAEADTGIIFKRTDLKVNNLIYVNHNSILDSKFCSKVQNDFGVYVQTVEHLMSALSALSIDNILIEIDSPEVPAMDGSSKEFTLKILNFGRKYQNSPRKYIKILKPVEIGIENRWISVKPSDNFEVNLEIDYENKIIGNHLFSYEHTEERYINEITMARTFALQEDIKKIRSSGFGMGGNLNNAIIVGSEKIINDSGLRCNNEFIKHKILDCIGDFYLCGYQILGQFNSYAPGHSLNLKIIKEILKNKENYEIVNFVYNETPNIKNLNTLNNYNVA